LDNRGNACQQGQIVAHCGCGDHAASRIAMDLFGHGFGDVGPLWADNTWSGGADVVVPVDRDTGEAAAIEMKFLSCGGIIREIFRIENAGMYLDYSESNVGGEVVGFHGTPTGDDVYGTIESFALNGIDISRSKRGNLGGPAIYLAEQAYKADMYASGPTRLMFMCHAFAGVACTLPRGTRCTTARGPPPGFDSIVGELCRGQEMALFENMVYPAYAIVYSMPFPPRVDRPVGSWSPEIRAIANALMEDESSE